MTKGCSVTAYSLDKRWYSPWDFMYTTIVGKFCFFFSLKGCRKAWYVCVLFPCFIFKLPLLQRDCPESDSNLEGFARLDWSMNRTCQPLQRLTKNRSFWCWMLLTKVQVYSSVLLIFFSYFFYCHYFSWAILKWCPCYLQVAVKNK